MNFTFMDAFECSEGTGLSDGVASDSAALTVDGPVSKANGVEVACEHLRQEALCAFLPSKLIILQEISPCNPALDPRFADA